MKKIVIVINSLESGGAERVVSNLLNSWVDKYDCYLILIHNKVFYDLDEKIKILHLNEVDTKSGIRKFFALPILSYKLSKIIKEHKFDKIISFLTRANYINVLSNIFVKHTSIISERAMPSLQYQFGLSSKINKYLIKQIYPRATLCLTNSQGNMLDLKNNFGVSNLDWIPNPFDLDKIEKLSMENVRIRKEKFTFVTVGRLDNGKNHKLIIDAIKNLDAELWIIGDGVLKENLIEYIKDLKIENKVFLLGKQTNPFSYLSKADCFVFSSNHEGFPNVLVEALSCGLPVISTDCKSGPREILAPNSNIEIQLTDELELSEYGILVPIQNINKLKESMNLIIEKDDLRKKYSNKSKARAEEFSLEKIIKKFEKVVLKDFNV